MNNEPASSSTANRSPNDSEYVTSSPRPNEARPATKSRNKRERNKRMFNRKKVEFVDDILLAFDIMIYIELSTIYYMDCSFLRLFLRSIVQFFYLTPKPAMFPDPPKNRPHPVGLIIGTNIFCALLHLWVRRPEAGEAARGYLHGGLLLDFVGQKGPSSKFHMLLLDILVLMLQIVMLCAFIERQKLKQALASSSEQGSSNTSTTQQGSNAPTAQNHDFEERGLLRSDPQALDDIELQSLTATGASARPGAEDGAESDERLEITSSRRTDAHIFDAFNSGQMIVTDLYVLDIIRSQYAENWNRSREAGPSLSTFSANLPGGGSLGFRMRIGGRTLGQGNNG
ncbi:MAG: hypothetical protein M1820_006833 [Bogoriella megaspora]|nr:MAG: hypothetical protein M1820_006833 [Bogoriella megaspora]